VPAGHLRLAFAHLGRFGEAESYARIAIEAAAEDDLASQVQGRVAQARVLSAPGRHDEAIALAREAEQMFADAQNPSWQGDLCMELAEVLRAAGGSMRPRRPPAADSGTTSERRSSPRRTPPARSSPRLVVRRNQAERDATASSCSKPRGDGSRADLAMTLELGPSSCSSWW
jgi:tetratricopeptide (TPR) repeat protein